MKGETTLEQRTTEQVRRLEDVRKHYLSRFPRMDDSDLVSQLIADAVWLMLYNGIDPTHECNTIIGDVVKYFPDIN